MIRSVSLDLGGTLLTEEPPRYEIYAQEARTLLASATVASTARASKGAPVASEEVTAAHMKTLMRRVHARMPVVWEGSYRYSDPWFERFIHEVFGVELGLDPPAVRTATARLFERFEAPATFRLFPGTDALLTGIRELGLGVGVLSNWSARLPRVLEAVGLADALDWVVCSAIDRVEKPDPAAFRLAARRAGAAPESLLHAGDRADLDGAATRVGCRFVLVRHRDHDERSVRIDTDGRTVRAADATPPGAPRPEEAADLAELLHRIQSHVQ